MRIKFSRKEILTALRNTINEGKPVIGAGCSAGLIAKCAEIGGADLIIVYSTGKSRLMGLPTTRMGDMVTNSITIEMAPEILNVVQDTPVIGGAGATDPTRMDLNLLFDEFMDAGFSGIINFPTVLSFGGTYRKGRESLGLGIARELDLVRIARENDTFTMAYVYTPDEAAEMAQAGADCIVPHVGGTSGGLSGFKGVSSLEQAAESTQRILESARRKNEEIICLSHGGPLAEPEDTRYIYEHTDAVGYVGASSVERIPVEKAVIGAVKAFKDQRIGS